MTNHKLQQIMADKHRARTTQEQEGISNLLARIKEIRTQAAKAQPEDVKNVEGVRQRGYARV